MARRERRAVYLEETLLGNRFAPYAVYRLRYFVARLVIASAMHAVTVSLLYRFFDRRHFAIVLVAYAAASAVGSFWWGSLEALRGEVRRLYRTSSPHRIPQAVGRWLTLALQLALLTAAGTNIAVRAVGAALSGKLSPQKMTKKPSRQWYHPTVWKWLWIGVSRGIW